MAEELGLGHVPTSVVTAFEGDRTKEIKDASGKPLFTAAH